MNISEGDYVVVGDLHGRAEKLRTVADYYGDRIDGIILTGDIVDGPDTKATLDLAMSIGAHCVASNHGEHLVTAMAHPDEEMRYMIATTTWPRVQKDVLSSYSIYPTTSTPRSAQLLRQKMEEVGHFEYLWNAPGYIEGTDFVVLHADVASRPWDDQKTELDNYIQTRMWNFERGQMPEQFGEGISRVDEANLAACGLQKTLISGHFHMRSRDEAWRTLSNGQHKLIATHLNDDFVVAYETATQRMHVLDVAN